MEGGGPNGRGLGGREVGKRVLAWLHYIQPATPTYGISEPPVP